MMIIREEWLEKIRPFYQNNLIKVLIGIRRCGKSILLRQIANELKESGIDDSHIIFINFEDLRFAGIKNDQDLYNYIQPLFVDNKRYYLFFDEIQNVTDFEKAVNSFRATNDVSIFITGSNAKLLSGELATILAGRYVTFKIMPFTFKEACLIQNIAKPNNADLLQYLQFGGMPQRFQLENQEDQQILLSDLYDSIIVKDIVTRYNVQNIDQLKRIINYLAATSSQLFSASSITAFFKNEGRNCSKETLYNYLSYVTSACIFNKLGRYDLQGKRQLATLEKYYLTDTGFGNICTTRFNIGAALENIVFNQLVADGYTISLGVNGNTEIDFVASKGSKKIYYQVCYLLADETTISREFGAFKNIDDNYPKYVISADNFDFSQNGIIHKNILDWLMGDAR